MCSLHMCVCVFVCRSCVQSHGEGSAWSEARLRGHAKDSHDATQASRSEARACQAGLQAELTPRTPPATSWTSLSLCLSLSLCGFLPPLPQRAPPLPPRSPPPAHASRPSLLSHTLRATAKRAAAKWPALCFILLLVRFCFCL